MNINNNYNSFVNKSGNSFFTKSKTISQNKWKLTEDLTKNIIELARKDAADNIYMGEKYHALINSEVAKVAPDREALKAKATAAIKSGNITRMKNDELYDRWIILFFGKPYGVEGTSMEFGHSVHIYNEYGEEVLIYTGGSGGWQVKETQAESDVWQTTTKIYYEAFCNERNIIKNNTETDYETQYIEMENSFDVKA